MSWSQRYAAKSYLLSAVWTAPVIALLLEQATFRIAYLHQLDFGFIPGFLADRDGTVAVTDYVITSSIAFIVFTFSSLIVAIQVASGQLTSRIIATTLLRDKAIRISAALFIYALLLAIAVKTRVDTIPRFLVSLTAMLGLVSVVAFMFLIDHAARLLRPVNIVWRITQQGLKVIDDVYPDPILATAVPTQAPEARRSAVRRSHSFGAMTCCAAKRACHHDRYRRGARLVAEIRSCAGGRKMPLRTQLNTRTWLRTAYGDSGFATGFFR